MSRSRTISLPEELCSAAERKFLQRFGSLEELVITLLREMVRDDAMLMDEQEQRIVEERLKGLGYI
jgi:hypothetical protein